MLGPNIKLLIALLSSFAIANTAVVEKEIPIIVAVIPGADACPSLGEITGLKFTRLNVRAGPGIAFTKVDAVKNGQRVYLCNLSKDGEWHGVVYPKNHGNQDCGVTTAKSKSEVYSGPCEAGWVHSSWVKVIAG